jgi:hypothetical protein
MGEMGFVLGGRGSVGREWVRQAEQIAKIKMQKYIAKIKKTVWGGVVIFYWLVYIGGCGFAG